jgi:predicted ABC-type ATPase
MKNLIKRSAHTGYKGMAAVVRQANANLRAMEKEVDTDVMEPQEKEFSISGGSFFKENPDKLLAEEYEASGRFGKVKKYRPKEGTSAIDTLSAIETPVFIGHGITDKSAGKSVILTPDPVVTAEIKDNIDKSIAETERSLIKKQRSEKRVIQDFDEPAIKPTLPFEDVLRNYNPDLTDDEIKAFLWYMHGQGNTYRGRWLGVFNPMLLSQEQEAAFIKRWVEKGILFYFEGDLLPAFKYFSENLYERKDRLEKDKSDIISMYGEGAYAQQETKLNEVFSESYNNRLKLDDPDVERRLHLKPYGDFVKDLKIKNWNIDNQTGEPAPFYVIISGAAKTAGDINWYSKQTQVNQWRNTGENELSIADAFRYWLKHDSNRPSLPYNYTYEDIFRYYLDKKAVKDMEPTVLARHRALTKEIGDKYFGKFLAEVILESDRVMIETVWNEKYNGSRGLKTEKIPIAFECALNYPGDEPVEIRPEKREAVAFASIRGSSLNAYQVGVGKANLMTSNILTPKGWVKMRDIKPGMEVIGKNGHATKVLQVFPQGKMPAYRVTFSDGSYTEVTGDHLWTVQNIWDRYTGNWKTLTTSKISERIYNQRGNAIYSIPMVDPVQFEHKNVPIDPYLLGALIGDGGLTADVSFSNPEIEIQNKIKSIIESAGLSLNPEKGQPDKDFRISRGNNRKINNTILDSLRELGLMGKKSIDKFIPAIYLYNSIDVRLALLQGLMDTDGYVNRDGHCTQICISSKKLAEDIVELVRSFGGTINENTKHPKFTYKGETKDGHEAYVLTIRLPANIIPFSTKKHLNRFKPKTKYIPVRFINSIEPIGKYEAQCILVESEDHLYVCDEYIVTHNTWAAILTMAQFLDAEQCKRPFLVVPNQVYKQFFSEMKGILPHRKINDLYNLSKDYIDKLRDENGAIMKVDEGSISILTYEGFERIGFNDDTQSELLAQLEEALTQITTVAAYNESKSAEKEAVRKEEKLKGLIGKALQKTETNIEELGFDFVCFDEAHALKNIFSQVKAKSEKGEGEDSKRGKKMYEISGSSSTRGIKAYCLCSYIQMRNQGRNVLLLTATPFTNSPLEVYSMLSLVAYTYLQKIGLSNINNFFDNYCQMSYELVIDSRLQPIRKQVFKAFDNLLSLQKLVYTYMLHKEAGKADANGNIIALIRPDKYVLPYKGHFNEKNEFIAATPEEYIDTVLPLSEEQKLMMDDIIAYAEGKKSYGELSSRGMTIIEEGEEEPEGDAEIFHIDEKFLKDDEKAGVRVLRGVNFARSLALSPYLYEFSGLGEPDHKSYIEKSPKLKYIMECVRSVKKWHEDKKEAVSGQVIYMDRGKKYFELLKDYLVKEIGYSDHEIGIIRSGKEGTSKHKDMVKNLYNGLEFDEKSKTFSDIPDEKRIKIIIGTSSIREGLNLQRYGTVLYNAFVDWNPTDEIQLEGRVWRQGNSFKNVRIVLPMMSDSMDIFMFQKLEEKTERINSIWNHDGKSNVLKIEEIDPKEQKMALVTDPKVIAELEIEGDIAKMDEDSAEVENNMQIAQNIIGFYESRAEFEKDLTMVLAIIEPEKTYPSIETMIKDFESALTSGKNSKEEACKDLIEASYEYRKNKYNYSFIQSYNYTLTRSYTYGRGKGAVTMLKKAKKSFLERYNIADDSKALQDYINAQEKIRQHIQEDKTSLSSKEHIDERAVEIEKERQRKQIRFATVEERVDEFKKLNYLLGIKRDKEFIGAEAFMWEEVEGCPPLTSDEKRDISPEGIRKMEACLERIPQTKDLNTDETGEYTEAREKLHKVIKGKLRAGMQCKVSHETPVAIFTGGVPGSGKTTFLKDYAPWLTKSNIFRIDADEIREMLPEYKGWNSKATHRETQDIYRSLLQDVAAGKPCRFDILWDGTMNKAENYLPLIGDLKRLGYQIFMIYVDVPWEVSRKRVLDRYVHTGRYVPMSVVDAANTVGKKGFEQLKDKADGYLIVDGMTKEITSRGGKEFPADRGYFERKATGKDVDIKKAKAKAIAQKQRIRILKLKEE